MKHINTWLKLYHNIYDSPKMIQIETMKNGDTIQGIFLRLMCYACELGNDGVFSIVVNGEIKPFTPQMFARRFHKSTKVLENSLIILENLNMINKNECAVIIVGWAEHQNKEQTAERLTSKREYMKDYNKKSKEEKKVYAEVMPDIKDFKYTLDVDVREEKNKNIPLLPPLENPIEKQNEVNFQEIVDIYNRTCISLTKVIKLSESRKKAIHARLLKYSVAEVTKAFEMAQASDFMKGSNKTNWKADFDWIMNDSNLIKIIEGKYSNLGDMPNPQKDKQAEMERQERELLHQESLKHQEPIKAEQEPLEKVDLNLTGLLAKVKM